MIRAGTPMDNTDPVITALKREARRLMLRGRVRAYLAFLSRKITNTQRPRSSSPEVGCAVKFPAR